MIYKTFSIDEKGSLPDARLAVYIQENSQDLAIKKRPLILLCPGGGYGGTSDREAEPMALAFLAMGYHAAILRYSCAPATYPTALLELASCVLLIRKHAQEWHVDADKLIVEGCSAGGHLAASYGLFWNEDFVAEGIGLKAGEKELLRPNGMILCYPVITSGEFAHRGSFANLLGEQETVSQETSSLEKLSLEKSFPKERAWETVPRTFIWHTFEDPAVPAENSLLFVSELRRAGIPTEFHMYSKGGHGLALANHLTESASGGGVQEECTSWVNLVHTWIEGTFQ